MKLTEFNQIRLERIAKMRMAINPVTGMYNTLEDIGRVEGVTRERIRQLLMFRPDVPKKVNKRRVFELTCKECGIKFESFFPRKMFHDMSCYLRNHQLRKDKVIKDYTKTELAALAHARYMERPEYWANYAKRPYVVAKRKIYSKSPNATAASKRWYDKNRETINARSRKRWKEDPDYRTRMLASMRKSDLVKKLRRELSKQNGN